MGERPHQGRGVRLSTLARCTGDGGRGQIDDQQGCRRPRCPRRTPDAAASGGRWWKDSAKTARSKERSGGGDGRRVDRPHLRPQVAAKSEAASAAADTGSTSDTVAVAVGCCSRIVRDSPPVGGGVRNAWIRDVGDLAQHQFGDAVVLLEQRAHPGQRPDPPRLTSSSTSSRSGYSGRSVCSSRSRQEASGTPRACWRCSPPVAPRRPSWTTDRHLSGSTVGRLRRID